MPELTLELFVGHSLVPAPVRIRSREKPVTGAGGRVVELYLAPPMIDESTKPDSADYPDNKLGLESRQAAIKILSGDVFQNGSQTRLFR